MPYENQLANKAEMKPSKSLNEGIDSAMTKARIQNPLPRPIQVAVATKPRLPTLAVPANIRRYTYLAVTWANITPAMTIVGRAIPHATLRIIGPLLLSAGDATFGPAKRYMTNAAVV